MKCVWVNKFSFECSVGRCDKRCADPQFSKYFSLVVVFILCSCSVVLEPKQSWKDARVHLKRIVKHRSATAVRTKPKKNSFVYLNAILFFFILYLNIFRLVVRLSVKIRNDDLNRIHRPLGGNKNVVVDRLFLFFMKQHIKGKIDSNKNVVFHRSLVSFIAIKLNWMWEPNRQREIKLNLFNCLMSGSYSKWR